MTGNSGGGSGEAALNVQHFGSTEGPDHTFGQVSFYVDQASIKQAKSRGAVERSHLFALLLVALIVTKLLWAAVVRACSSGRTREALKKKEVLFLSADSEGVRHRRLYSRKLSGPFNVFQRFLYDLPNHRSISEGNTERRLVGASWRRLADERKDESFSSSTSSPTSDGGRDGDQSSIICEELLGTQESSETENTSYGGQGGSPTSKSDGDDVSSTVEEATDGQLSVLSRLSANQPPSPRASEETNPAGGSSPSKSSTPHVVDNEEGTAVPITETLEALQELIEEAFRSPGGSWPISSTSESVLVAQQPKTKKQMPQSPVPRKRLRLDDEEEPRGDDEQPSTSLEARRALQSLGEGAGILPKRGQQQPEQSESSPSSEGPESPIMIGTSPVSEAKLSLYIRSLENVPKLEIGDTYPFTTWHITPEMIGMSENQIITKKQARNLLQLLSLSSLSLGQCSESLVKAQQLLCSLSPVPAIPTIRRRHFLQHLCITVFGLYALQKLNNILPQTVNINMWWPMLMQKLDIEEGSRLTLRTVASPTYDRYVIKAQNALKAFLSGDSPSAQEVAELLLLYELSLFRGGSPMFQ